MKKSNFVPRRSPSLMEEARKVAKAEGLAVNQLINVAVAEKVSALRTEECFAERAARGDVKRPLDTLKRTGAGKTPGAADELPTGKRVQRPRPLPRENGSIDDQLRFAIANKRLVQFTYLGSLRVAEPHDYGVRKGRTMLLVYQRRGSSSSQRTGVKGWKLLDVSKIQRCSVLEESFAGSRGDSHQHHYTWDIVYARVA